MKISTLSLLLCLIAAPLLVACDSETDNPYILGGEKPTPSKPSPTTAKGDAARLEMPLLKGDIHELFVVHKTKPTRANADSVTNFAYAYDTEKYHSRWVAFRFDADTRPKIVTRKEPTIRPKYPIDPKLPKQFALASDASFNGNDHGHLCASADRLYSREANDQTFYMSNMSPQMGDFNQRYWTAIENHVQTLGRDASFADTLYVVKGGTIDAPNVLTLVSNNRVPQPKYYFVALLKVKNGTYSSIGFWMEHKKYGINAQTKDMVQHVVSIAQLEELSGINFFHNLPDMVERSVESAASLSAWRLN